MIFASNGATLHICTTEQNSDYPPDKSAYENLNYIVVSEVESIGPFGKTWTVSEFPSLEARRILRAKGAVDAGSIEIVAAFDYSDAGQLAILEALSAEDGDYAFKIVFADAPSGGTPSVRYFLAIVTSANEVLDAADNIQRLRITLWINSEIVRVAAAGP